MDSLLRVCTNSQPQFFSSLCCKWHTIHL